MFIDASAIIAILAGEDDAASLVERLGGASDVHISAIAIYEATTGLARKRAWSVEEAEALVDEFIRETGAQAIDIDRRIARLALDAFRRYGKGRHSAGLNLGDCFAYACASSVGAPLLFIGNDFSQTDIAVA